MPAYTVLKCTVEDESWLAFLFDEKVTPIKECRREIRNYFMHLYEEYLMLSPLHRMRRRGFSGFRVDQDANDPSMFHFIFTL